MPYAIPEPTLKTDPSIEQLGSDRLYLQPRPTRVLVGDDDPLFRKVLSIALRKKGNEVGQAQNGVEVLGHLGDYLRTGSLLNLPDVIILDYLMPGVTGLEILEGLEMATVYTSIIVVSGYGGGTLRQKAFELGAVAVLDKPKETYKVIEPLCDLVRTLAP